MVKKKGPGTRKTTRARVVEAKEATAFSIFLPFLYLPMKKPAVKGGIRARRVASGLTL